MDRGQSLGHGETEAARRTGDERHSFVEVKIAGHSDTGSALREAGDLLQRHCSANPIMPCRGKRKPGSLARLSVAADNGKGQAKRAEARYATAALGVIVCRTSNPSNLGCSR